MSPDDSLPSRSGSRISIAERAEYALEILGDHEMTIIELTRAHPAEAFAAGWIRSDNDGDEPTPQECGVVGAALQRLLGEGRVERVQMRGRNPKQPNRPLWVYFRTPSPELSGTIAALEKKLQSC